MASTKSPRVESKSARPPRWLLGVLFGSALFVGAAVAIGIALIPRWLEHRVIREAAERGWYLRFAKLDFSLRQIRLTDVELRPLADAGWSMSATSAEVDLVSFSPSRVRLEMAQVSSPRPLWSLLETLQEHFPRLPEFPVEISELGLNLTGDPVVTATAKPITIEQDRLQLGFPTFAFQGVPLGPMDITLTKLDD